MRLLPVVSLLTVLLVFGPGASVLAHQATLVAPVHATPSTGTTLDLAAMLLTPVDLPTPGFGTLSTASSTSAQLATYSAAYLGIDAKALLQEIETAGFRHRFDRGLGLPSQPGDATAPPQTIVASYIIEFADAAGADAAFTRLEDERGVPSAHDLNGIGTLGDRVEITRDNGTWDWNGTSLPYVSLDLSFLHGALYGDVTMYAFGGDEPTEEAVMALGRTLLERMDADPTRGGPGLSERVVRFVGEGLTAFQDGYYRLDGEDIPFYGEVLGDPARFQLEAFGIASDVYETWSQFGAAGVVQVRLYRFADADAAAAARVQGMDGPLSYVPGYEQRVTPAPTFSGYGDESIAHTYESVRPQVRPTGFLHGVVVAVRIGSEIVVVDIETPTEAPRAEVKALVTAQVACLTGGACPPRPVPALFTDSATPSASTLAA